MSDEDRLASAEEQIMRLQMDQEQLDRVIQAQAHTVDQLLQRIEQLEQRLDRVAPEDG